MLWIWWGVCLLSRSRRTSVTSLTWWVLSCFPEQTHSSNIQVIIVSGNSSLALLQNPQLLFWSNLGFLKSLCSCPHVYTGVIWGGHKEVIVSCHVNEKYCSLKPMMNATFFPFRALVMQWRAAGTNKNFFIDENRKADRRSRTDASCC